MYAPVTSTFHLCRPEAIEIKKSYVVSLVYVWSTVIKVRFRNCIQKIQDAYGQMDSLGPTNMSVLSPLPVADGDN